MTQQEERLSKENAYLQGKVEAYENVLGLKGYIEQKECENFGEGLEA